MGIISISTKYLGKLYLTNLALVLIIFIAIFSIVDSISSSFGFTISMYRSIINLDGLFSIICGIATIITLLKLKQTSQDVALISLDKSPMYIFHVFMFASMVTYFAFIIIIHPLAFAGVKKYQFSQVNECKFESGGQLSDANNINVINKIKYEKCAGIANSLEEFEISFDDKNNVKVEIYSKDLNLPNGKNAIIHDLSSDKITFGNKKIKDERGVRNLYKVDMYKKDLKDKQISIYHMIYSLLRDNNGVISTSDVIDSVFTKVKNTLMIIVFINACYFILVASKRGFMVTKVTVKTVIFMQTYYIITYLISEKLSYSDSILIKIGGFTLIHCFFIIFFSYFQGSGILSFREFIKKVYTKINRNKKFSKVIKNIDKIRDFYIKKNT